MAIRISGSTIIDDSRNIINAGVVTATSFVGSGANLTGISSASFATTSFGLSGNPTITVSGISTSTGTSNQFLKADGSIDSNSYTSIGKAIAMTIVFGWLLNA